MTDCYRILGVAATASTAEIRAAYLALMKAAHPDARPDDSADNSSASDITFAYWHLRDPARRTEHDRKLAELLGLGARKPVTPRRSSVAVRKPVPARARRRRRSSRLQPLRTAAGIAAFAVAASAFVLCFTYLQPETGGEARAATALSGLDKAEARPPARRRAIDPTLQQVAAQEFRSIVRASGIQGAHLYGRQCLTELAVQPSPSMLDYCIAFDNSAAAWERSNAAQRASHHYFDDEQRLARYRGIAEATRSDQLREMLLTEASYLTGDGS